MSTRVRIEPGAVEAAVRHARECFPWECCGLLIGKGAWIRSCVPGRNAARRTDRFELDLDDWLRAGSAGQIVGAYHSHPAGTLAESSRDRVSGVQGVRWMMVVTVAGAWRVSDRGA